jgi:hypothetical protein
VPRTARRATAHGLADILADQAGSGAGGRRTEAAQTTGVSQFAGTATTATEAQPAPLS